MPSGPALTQGNANLDMLLTVNIAAGTVANATITAVTTAVSGLLIGDYVDLSPAITNWAATQPALNLGVCNPYVSATGVLSVAFQNSTAATITQTTALPYIVRIARSQNYSIAQTLPTAIV